MEIPTLPPCFLSRSLFATVTVRFFQLILKRDFATLTLQHAFAQNIRKRQIFYATMRRILLGLLFLAAVVAVPVKLAPETPAQAPSPLCIKCEGVVTKLQVFFLSLLIALHRIC